MRNQEEGLNSGGELQRGSNLGSGQVLAADYFIIPDIAAPEQNSGGSNVGAAFGHFLPGGFGAVVGSISVHSQEASTVITLVDARTTEHLYVARGRAPRRPTSASAAAAATAAGPASGRWRAAATPTPTSAR